MILLLDAYCVGIDPFCKIERACCEALAFRVLSANQQPHHSRICDIRRRNLDALKVLFVQILWLCQIAGMVSLVHVALDGTKVKVDASPQKAMSHEQMLNEEKTPGEGDQRFDPQGEASGCPGRSQVRQGQPVQ